VRTVRIVGAILLLVLIFVLATGLLRRFHAAPDGGQAIVKKAPPPPGSRNARNPTVPDPAALAASPSCREDAAGRAESRRNIEVRGGEERGGRVPGPVRGAASVPLVVDDGEMRIFIDGTGNVFLPVVLRGTGTRILVESTGDGCPAEVLVAAVPDGTATVSALSGAVAVAAEGRRVPIAAGTFTAVGRGAPPSPPERLPPPPDLAEPPDDATFVYGILPPRVSFSWIARGSPDGFRFVLARDPGFRRVVLDERLPGPRLTQSSLEEGIYYWRVSAVANGVAGLPGASARLKIVRHGAPPELLVRPPTPSESENVRIVTGRTEPGVKVFVSGTPVPVNAAGSFSCRVSRDGTVGAIVVEAVGPLGNAAYDTRWAP